MPWVRIGDDSATFPALMSVMGQEGADERLLNEVAGFLFRIATLSGAHLTDYVVDAGTCFMIGGSRTQELIKYCVKAGLLEKTEAFGGKAVRVIENPDFIHLILKKEHEWGKQRKKDLRDPRLLVPVRKRDGDQCRYCGVRVQWRGRTSHCSGTYDHRVPGEAAKVETLVVACTRCNTSRQDNLQWDDENPLQPPPAEPLYSKVTVDFLANNGVTVEQNILVEPAREKPVSVEPKIEQPDWSRAVDAHKSEPAVDDSVAVEPRVDDHDVLMEPATESEAVAPACVSTEPGMGRASRLEPSTVEPRAADHSALMEPVEVEPREVPACASVEPAPVANEAGEKYAQKFSDNSISCPPKINFVGSGRVDIGSGSGRVGQEGRSVSGRNRRKRRG